MRRCAAPRPRWARSSSRKTAWPKRFATTSGAAAWRRWKRTVGRAASAGHHAPVLAPPHSTRLRARWIAAARCFLEPARVLDGLLLPEAVFEEVTGPEAPVRTCALPPPGDDEVEALLLTVALRAVKLLRKRGKLEEPAACESALDFLRAQATRQQRLRLGEEQPPPRKRRLCAFLDGFSLHADSWVHQNNREGLERLANYGARGPLTRVSPEAVEAGGGLIRARTVLWAAGVEAAPLAKSLGVPLDRAGRVVVDPDLTVPGHPEVYVLGDLAAFVQDGKPLPGLAPVALQQGHAAAQNILRGLRNQPRLPFRYRDRGIMATIGRSAGVAQRGRLRLSGFLGWAAWLFIHLLFLVGFRNKLLVLFEWAWDWWTYKRGVRLITGPTPRLPSSGT